MGTPYFFSRRRRRQDLPLALSIACSSWGCTLITDVDRERIPVPVQPPFDEVDGGAEPPVSHPDAAAADAATPDASVSDDAGSVPDASATASDAAAPSGDAG